MSDGGDPPSDSRSRGGSAVAPAGLVAAWPRAERNPLVADYVRLLRGPV